MGGGGSLSTRRIGVATFACLAVAFTQAAFAEPKIVPAADVAACVRVGGDVCRTVRDTAKCDAWHREHAAEINADTVVITDSEEHGQVFGFIGKRSEVAANYYRCENPGAITSPPEDWERESWKYESYIGAGDTSITGQAFLRQRGGEVVTCAGSPVLAVPVGYYFDRLTVESLPGLHPDAQLAIRRTTCDATGNFRFSKLPAEKWRIVTKVSWETADRFSPIQGGIVSRVVDSRDGVEPVYLTNADVVR